MRMELFTLNDPKIVLKKLSANRAPIRVGKFKHRKIVMNEFDQLIPRHAEERVRTALGDTRIVALVGPRQSGKSTLAQKIADEKGMQYVSLDNQDALLTARDDPRGFFQNLDRAVIDEIQRAPNLILALKLSVDTDTRPGRFLITGSVDLFKSMLTPDSLAGRMETIELLPLSQAEIEQKEPVNFLDKAFECDFPGYLQVGFSENLVERVITGGYPEVYNKPNRRRRQNWLTSYVSGLADKDVSDIGEINKVVSFQHFIDRVAANSGQVVKLEKIGGDIGVDKKTVERWLMLLEQMFLIRRIRPWFRNNLKRLMKKPKLHFLDSGVLATILNVSEKKILANRGQIGNLLEGFVYSELYKHVEQHDDRISIFHYRDLDQREVDFIIERDNKIVAIEVKAKVTMKSEDFSAMKRLKENIGSIFACGIVLNTGDRIQRMGEKLYAMPVSQLWS